MCVAGGAWRRGGGVEGVHAGGAAGRGHRCAPT
jgi:hypothetical protein